ncbi:MAG: hypothetical protein Q7T97_02625 [Burkholderiaceae bacterium]|nr:hypothetical protein [Burkholderiaceae bacterium]
MLTIKVFLSSPGDVADERRLAVETMRSLEDSPLLRDRVNLQIVAWDDPAASAPLDARETPQASVNRWAGRPADCDLTLAILWSRLGTPLPHSLTRADGSRYASGTVWEVEDAIAGDRPVFVYRRTEKPRIELDDPAFDTKRAQYDAVRRWFDGLRDEDGAWRSGVNEYADLMQFQQLLRAHLEAFIGQRMAESPPHAPGVHAGQAFAAGGVADPSSAQPTVAQPSSRRSAATTATRSTTGWWVATGAAGLALAGVLAWGLRASPDPAVGQAAQAGPPVTAAAPSPHASPAPPAAADPSPATTTPPEHASTLPQVRLAGSSEAQFTAMRGSTYSVLSLTPEAGATAERWRLRLRVRLATNPNSGGMNFWDSSFRLLIDGVPRAPDSTLNEVVESGAAKDGDLVFSVPWTAQALALRVMHYGETTELPFAVSGTRRPQPVSLPAGPHRVTLDGPAELKFPRSPRATYSILAVGTESRRPGVYGVRLRMRMHVLDSYSANFGDSQFRLLIDGVPHEADSGYNKVVGGGAAEDGDITFEVPDGARQLALRVIHSAELSADVPLTLAPAK